MFAIILVLSQFSLSLAFSRGDNRNFGSCSLYGCGASGVSNSCGCDGACTARGDCCYDFQEVCNSCYDLNCEEYDYGRPCQCDKKCVEHGTCCTDYHLDCTKGKFEEQWKAPERAEDRRQVKSRLRVLEYNVEWLFTNFSHTSGSNKCPGSGCPWNNNTLAREHLDKVAKVMAAVDFDIGVLPEVCDAWTLRQLIEHMGASAPLYKAYLIKGTDTALGQNVGLITKIDPISDLERTEKRYAWPVQGSECGSYGSGTSGCTKHFKTRFKVQNLAAPLTVVGLHFLAHPTDHLRCAKREAQASVLRDFLLESQQSDHFIVTGDYNDYDDEVMDAANSVPNSHVTRILREWRNPQLHAVAARISPQSSRYSGWWDKNGNCQDDGGGEHTSIDHMLVDEDLFHKIQAVRFDHVYPNHCKHVYSDHWPLVVDFDLS